MVKKEVNLNTDFINDMAASFQNTISNIIVSKLQLTINYLKKRNIYINQISLVGGVANNKYIYEKVKAESKKHNCNLLMPPKEMLSDNAAMIGWACAKKYSKDFKSDFNFKPNPRLTIN